MPSGWNTRSRVNSQKAWLEAFATVSRQQGVAAVAVEKFGAGREVQFFLMLQHRQNFFLRDDIVQPPPRHEEQFPIGSRMPLVWFEQVHEGDFRTEVGQIRQVFVNVVFQRELAFLFEAVRRRKRRELLGNGSHVKHGVPARMGIW